MSQTSMLTGNALTIQYWNKKSYWLTMQQTCFGRLFNRGSVFYADELMGARAGRGDKYTYAFIGQLTGMPVGEGGTLVGHEEALDLGSHTMTMGLSRFAVLSPNTNTIEQQRTNVDFENAARELIPQRAGKLFDAGVFAHLGGANPNTITIDGTTYSTANEKLHVQGHNTPVAPTRIIRAGTAANDESLTSSDTISLDLIDFALEQNALSSQPIERYSDGTFDLYVSPADVTYLKHNSGAKIQWFNIQLAKLTGGSSNQIESQFENDLIMVGKYADVNIIMAPRVAMGVNSSTGAQISTVRRNVLVGKNALSFASPFGGRPSDKDTPIKLFVQEGDYTYRKGVEGRLIYGLKKTTPTNGIDVGVHVIATYAAAH